MRSCYGPNCAICKRERHAYPVAEVSSTQPLLGGCIGPLRRPPDPSGGRIFSLTLTCAKILLLSATVTDLGVVMLQDCRGSGFCADPLADNKQPGHGRVGKCCDSLALLGQSIVRVDPIRQGKQADLFVGQLTEVPL